jgi:metal-responsive CopG/Arc/MetJ family transcriptional regulator
METARLNITLPGELVEELDHLVGPRQKSRFIATILRERLTNLREERLEQLLKEGYQTRHREAQEIAKDFEYTDLEGWDEY